MTQNNRERLRQAQAAAAKQQRLNRIIGVGAGVLVVVLIGVFIGVLVQNQSHQAATSAAAVTPPNATSDGKAIVISPGVTKQGAPVVELFFDYQCPYCKLLETTYGGTLTSLAASGDIELHYRTMSFLDASLNNDASLRAGIAATCADTVGKYSEFHTEIYTEQPETEGEGYSDTALRDSIPAALGITGNDLTTFQSCYDKQSTKGFVTTMGDLGIQDLQSINNQVSTPTVHVNGKDLPVSDIGQVQPDGLLDLIKQHA